MNAIIGGSKGFEILQRRGAEAKRIKPLITPFGEAQAVYDFGEYLYMSRHGEKGYSIAAPFVNYQANIWALKELGVERIIAWSGPAAIDANINVGEIVLPGDLIDETRHRADTFYRGTGLGFIRQNPTFCPHLHAALSETGKKMGRIARASEVYVCTEGPRLETAAEIRKFGGYGGTLVGMTLVPEAFLAKELEMCYAAVCYVTNYAEGVRERPFTPGVLFEGLLDDAEKTAVDRAVAAIPDLAGKAFELAGSREEICSCRRLMERYRRRGDIGDDWRKWIRSFE